MYFNSSACEIINGEVALIALPQTLVPNTRKEFPQVRFVTFETNGQHRVGVHLDGSSIIDLRAAQSLVGVGDTGPVASSLASLLERWDEAFPATQQLVSQVSEEWQSMPRDIRVDVSEVRLLAPLPKPTRLRDYLTYRGHADGVGKGLPAAFEQMPVCYKGNHLAVIGPDEVVPWPAFTEQLDFELEIGFYVAGKGCNWSVSEAASHVAGLTLFNDISARDIQIFEMSMNIGPSKGKDFCNIMGPCMVTMDEVDEFSLELTASVNGEEWSRGSSRDRQYSCAEVLAWASYEEPVFPGEFLALGTVGTGCGAELDRWIQPGDIVELAASGIGVLRSEIGSKHIPPPKHAGLPSFRGADRYISHARR